MSNSPLGLAQSHAHPDPNLVPAAAENLDLNSSKEPKLFFIASLRDPVGSPPEFGLIISQNKQ